MSRFLVTILSILTWSLSWGQGYFNTNGIAASGYDVVAYFEQQQAIKGAEQFALTWQNIEWRFSTQEHLDAFRQNPLRFAPQFGGYCAYGVSENHKAPTDPNAFTIVDDKLYLNYNLGIKEKWSKDTKVNIAKAEGNWPALRLQN